MTGIIVAGLLAVASVLLQRRRVSLRGGRRPVRPSPVIAGIEALPASRTPWYRRWRSVPERIDPHEVPLFVHQLAGLLKAGRPPGALWADIESVYTEGSTAFGRAVLPVIGTARRAAELGLSVPGALRQATVLPGAEGIDPPPGSTGRLWVDLAACLEIAERSGAPLAGILEHYATQVDAELEGLSARDTALAGPRATVVLLAWLPAVGLVLAFALGINPLTILIGTTPGRFSLAAGIALMITARLWSRRLVQHATGGAP